MASNEVDEVRRQKAHDKGSHDEGSRDRAQLTKQNIHKQSIKQAEIMQKTMYFGWKENEIAISRKGPVNSLYTIAYPALKKLNWWMSAHKNGLIVGGKTHNLNQMILIPWYLENRGVPVKKIHAQLKQY